MGIKKDWTGFAQATRLIEDKDNPVVKYGASQIPDANTIVVSDAQKEITKGWLPLLTYARYSVESSAPSSPQRNDMYYNTSDNKVYYYNGSTWVELDWKKWVEASPEYINGRLRYTNGYLEISPDGTNWYDCYPLVGASSFTILTIDTSSFSYKYWIPVGAFVSVFNTNHAPFVFYKPSSYVFNAFSDTTISGGIVLRINNTSTSGYQTYIYFETSVEGYNSTQANLFLCWGNASNVTGVIDYKSNNVVTALLKERHYSANYGLAVMQSNTTTSSTAHWMGTFRDYNDTNFITVPNLTVTRIM